MNTLTYLTREPVDADHEGARGEIEIVRVEQIGGHGLIAFELDQFGGKVWTEWYQSIRTLKRTQLVNAEDLHYGQVGLLGKHPGEDERQWDDFRVLAGETAIDFSNHQNAEQQRGEYAASQVLKNALLQAVHSRPIRIVHGQS